MTNPRRTSIAGQVLVATLLSACSGADALDERGTTALMRAARRGDTVAVYRELAAGADVNAAVPRRDVKEFIAEVAKLEELPKWESGFTPLLYASRGGHSRVARILIDSGADVSAASRHGVTPLGFALSRSDVAFVTELTRAGARANAAQLAKAVADGPADLVTLLAANGADASGMAPADPMRGRPWQQPLVIAATIRGDTAVVKALLDAGAKVDARDQNGWTALRWARDTAERRANPGMARVIPVLEAAGARDDAGTIAEDLFDAVRTKNAARVRAVLAKGANPNSRDNRGVTPVIHAALSGSTEIVGVLTAAGARLNVTPYFYYSPLTAAVESGNIESVKVLLTAGASADQRDGRGWTPLSTATAQRRHDVAALLLADSVRLDPNAMRHAARQGDTAIVQLLLDHGADAKAGAPLMWAVSGCRRGFDNSPVIAMLLRKGAKTRDNFNALSRAAGDCEATVLRLLISHGADPDERNHDGWTPLMIAAVTGRLENVQVLLAAGADHDARNDEGLRAFDYARRHPSIEGLLALAGEARSGDRPKTATRR